MSSSPASARALLPETGASTNSTSSRSLPSRVPNSVAAETPIVPSAPTWHRGPKACATPAVKITDSTTTAVGSMVITTRAPLTASCEPGHPRSRVGYLLGHFP